VDGTYPIPSLEIPQVALVKGDARSCCVAAASVVAKEHRDHLMREVGERYPGYGFEEHMGYPTEAHRAALRRLGPCPLHRRSFRGVRELLGPQLGLFGLT
jgi:ribonuclease HII